jgi:gliding motility-associated protein GldM
MATGAMTPRQKMINMMYLVLTAMLALNVSAEILKAFRKFEISMEASGTNLSNSSNKLIANLEKEAANQGEKAKPYYNKAVQAKQYTDDFCKWVDEIKEEFSKKGGGREEDGQLKMAKDIDIAQDYFVGKKDQGTEKGQELVKRINELKTNLLGLLNGTVAEGKVNSELSTEKDPKSEHPTWLGETFYQMPLGAAMAMLTNFQNMSKKTCNDVIVELNKAINAADYKFDALQATIVAPYGSVTSGTPYTAEIFLTAYNTKDAPKVLVNGQPITVEEGKGKYKVNTGSEGQQKYKAEIVVKDPVTGQDKSYFAEGEYMVFSPVATISASKMSIFYAGIPNPVEIAVPGYRPDQVTASTDNGAISGSGGKYNVTVQMGQNRICHINVAATSDKVTKTFTKEFKIRPLPPLGVTINGKEGGGVAGAEVQAWNFLNVSFGPSFAYDGLKYQATSWECIVQTRSGAQIYHGNGPQITADIKAAATKCRRGDMIIFYNIKATGVAEGGMPAGPPKSIDSGPVFRMQ